MIGVSLLQYYTPQDPYCVWDVQEASCRGSVSGWGSAKGSPKESQLLQVLCIMRKTTKYMIQILFSIFDHLNIEYKLQYSVHLFKYRTLKSHRASANLS